MKTPVTIVGAGFSGLTLAYYLTKLNVPVEVLESKDQVGGLIQTFATSEGLVETAANAALASPDLEALFSDLGLALAPRLQESRSRYIYWDGPKRWPLTWRTSVKVAILMLGVKLGFKKPHPQESVQSWAERCVNKEFADRLIGPALQGVYAGDPTQLSATLVLRFLFEKRRHKGSVAPVAGMGACLTALAQYLKNKGVPIYLSTNYKGGTQSPVALCTSAWQAAEVDTPLSAQLAQCESVPLISATCFFKPDSHDLKGFGCLFPKEQGFSALGVLFNSSIFAERSPMRSETWIFSQKDLSDEQILKLIDEDRTRLRRTKSTPSISAKISRYPRALPHYTVKWERTLRQLTPPKNLFLHGNYLGHLGLSQILTRSRQLAQEIKDTYEHT